MIDGALLQLDKVASLQTPTKKFVKTFDSWIKSSQHISDCSEDFLESIIPRGAVRPQKGKTRDNPELVTISKHADSLLTNLLKLSPLKLLFIVRRKNVCRCV
jgi:hypothetical protein